MNKQIIKILIVMLSSALPATFSYASIDETQLNLMRHQYLLAEQALEDNDMATFNKLKAQLEAYPLYPYLEQAELTQRLDTATTGEIQDFIQHYKSGPMTSQLHFRWLKALARNHKWKKLARHYRETKYTPLRCAYSHALYATGQKQRANKLTKQLWLTGHALPTECDTPLKLWQQQGKRTNKLVWQRINLAMRARETRLVRYLGKQLGKSEQFWVPLWFKVRRDPDFIIDVEKRFSTQRPVMLRWIIADALPRLARSQPETALSLWKTYSSRYNFQPREVYRIERSLLRNLADQPELIDSIIKKPEFAEETKRLQFGQLFEEIEKHNWSTALNLLEQLPTGTQQEPRWIYWRARILEALGRQNEAQSTYVINTSDRSYYSFLSADRIGDRYDYAHHPLSFDKQALSSLLEHPGLLRARELYVLNHIHEAHQEWRWATKKMNKQQLLKAATLANQWGWHNQVIATMAMAKYWDDLELRFPLAHQKTVVAQARQWQINPAWAFAVIRQESAFAPRARSHAGAMGLMQLMPQTARDMARSLQIRMQDKQDLFDAKTNIQLGVGYLKKVFDHFNGHKVLATAAYNAGQNRVATWLPEDSQSADLWIEKVPFSETRKYLKRVLTYTAIYERRMGLDTVPISVRMPPVSVSLDFEKHASLTIPEK